MNLLRRRAIALAAAATCVSLVACQLVLGVTDESGAPREAGTAADADADAAAPPCGKQPPSPPLASQLPDATDGVAFVVAFREFTINPPNTVLGYNLDDRCTTAGSNAAALPCKSPPGATIADDPGGVDNSFVREVIATFLAATDGGVPDPTASLLDAPIADGRRTILVGVTGYNGEANDAHVKVGFASSERMEQADGCDAGALYPPFDPNTDAAPPPPRWDGCDQWSYTPDSLVVNGAPAALYDGYVRDHVLVMTGASLTLSHYSLVLPFSDVIVTATITPDPATRLPSLRDGVITGRIRAERVLTASSALVNLACNEGKFELLKGAVCTARDISEHKKDDGTPAVCDSVSFALGFSASPAKMGHVGPPPPALACDAGLVACP